MLKIVSACIVLVCVTFCGVASAADAGFSFEDHPGQYLDVLLDGKIVGRYMDAYDISTPERRTETFKPYLHVFDAEGKEPITNGFSPKGEFPHHRGIFIGFRKITFNGKEYDRWHMHDSNGPVDPKTKKKGATLGEIVHLKLENQRADADMATFTSVTAWNDENAKPFLTEERTMTFRRAPAPARITIDFTSKLMPKGDCALDGDPEHAGVQYRPTNDIDKSKTLYVFPAEHPNAHKDLDYPWVGETYTLKNGKTYSVVEMSHPDDPKGTKWSAYRDYGRFGAFAAHEIKSGEALTLKYRFLIADGEMPPADVIEKSFNQFTGESNATPQLTVMPAEHSAPAKPKTPAAK
ncbi:MAG TPA: DUF6807 family protein [Tepidisphaeraceae bacterium]|jgi:hypothetical protein|nr:DUF6807 family protein [Tepidisphaeraceae bacterium]